MKKLLGIIIAIFAATSAAFAVIGTPPLGGFASVDSDWLNGLAGGHNRLFQNGFVAAGTTQATALQLPTRTALMEIDTAAASTGVALPPALQGVEIALYNNGAQTLTVYPAIANNPVTAAQDTINNGTSLSGGMATHTATIFFCAKNGVWAAK